MSERETNNSEAKSPYRSVQRWQNQARTLLFAVAFAIASIWSVRQVISSSNSVIPTTSLGISTVPLFNTWTILWNANRLENGLVGYWDAPIFHPAKGAFAFSDPQPATMIVAPVFWLTQSPSLAYRVYLILSLWLNGWFTARLLQRLRLTLFASLVGGVAMVWHPLVHAQMDVVQLVPLWPIIWLITSAMELRSLACVVPKSDHRLKRNSVLKGLETGVAAFFVFAISIHQGLFVAILAPATVWVLVPWRRIKQWWPGALASVATVALLITPLAMPVYRILSLNKFDRPESLVKELSAEWLDLVNVPSASLIRFSGQSQNRPWYLSPGWARMILAVIALAELRSIRRLRRRPVVLFLATLAIASALLSLGANLHVWGWQPWSTLSKYVPGVSQVRSVFRFGYFTQLALIPLCAIGFDRILRWMSVRTSGWRLRSLAAKGILTAIGVLLAIEVPPQPVQAVVVPDVSRAAEWQTFVRTRLEPGKCCMMLPYAPGGNVQDFDQTTRWMLTMTQQQIPILNGYSGFFPKSHFDNQKVFSEAPFSEDALNRIFESAVQFIIVQRQPELTPAAKVKVGSRCFVELVFEDPSGILVFELSCND